ncbi:MAG: hypothetical protein IGR92_16110 [Leptolyngbyaceae cyanobacterium T60_A2020_046]|nr:hypothetical protein [Leptolyngbyaceae cyanobacterium T60_A2020_046]
MERTQFGVSCCQRCRYYTPEGRRGGQCSQLDVPVQGKWTACSLATPFFLEPLRPLEALPVWSEELVLIHRNAAIAETAYTSHVA